MPPLDPSRFLTRLAAARKPSIIREMTKRMAAAGPELIPLSGGLPNPGMFPFKGMRLALPGGTEIAVEGKAMEAALQYLPTNGHAGLLQQLGEIQQAIHKPEKSIWENTEMVTTVGSQDGLSKAMEMMMVPNGAVIVQDYVYPGALASIDPYEPDYVVIASDSQGMIPSKLREGLQRKWSTPQKAIQDAKGPKFLYINPTGCNPTGANMTLDRREEIYQICCEYDLVILEDDPYYFLHFEDSYPKSFFSLDTDGRVIRFDSFSKILSSGIRLGFATGPKPLVNSIILHMQASVMHTSSLSQVLANELISTWGVDGFLGHVNTVQNFYKGRRDVMLSAADKHLDGLCDWGVPMGGMFLWMRAHGVDCTWDMIMERAIKKNVMLLPGAAFMPVKEKSPFMRASFSLATDDKIEVAFERLAELIREEQGKK